MKLTIVDKNPQMKKVVIECSFQRSEEGHWRKEIFPSYFIPYACFT